VGALLSNAPIVKYDDAAGILYCRQAMGNDKTRSAQHCLIQGLLHKLQDKEGKRSD